MLFSVAAVVGPLYSIMIPRLQETVAPFTVTERTAEELDASGFLDSHQSESIQLSFSFCLWLGKKRSPDVSLNLQARTCKLSKTPNREPCPWRQIMTDVSRTRRDGRDMLRENKEKNKMPSGIKSSKDVRACVCACLLFQVPQSSFHHALLWKKRKYVLPYRLITVHVPEGQFFKTFSPFKKVLRYVFSSLSLLSQMSTVPKIKWIQTFRNPKEESGWGHFQRSRGILSFDSCLTRCSTFWMLPFVCSFHVLDKIKPTFVAIYPTSRRWPLSPPIMATFTTLHLLSPLNLHRAQPSRTTSLPVPRWRVQSSAVWTPQLYGTGSCLPSVSHVPGIIIPWTNSVSDVCLLS